MNNCMDKTSRIKASRKLMGESRLERICDDVGMPEEEILSLLKATMGGDDTPPWPANQRWLLWNSAELIGHVSVQRRWFVVNRRYLEGWHVGGVCVHPRVQRDGIGSYLMEMVHADLSSEELGFAVLNCGRHLVGFYEGVGYTRVSDRAVYIRNGKLAIDEDPAMVIIFRKGFDITSFRCDAFPFGFDF